ncbi:MAG: HDIG domain-containing metalloprotein, partial [Candidatus Hodarchaeales archaeon]
MKTIPSYLECLKLLFSIRTPYTVISHSIFTTKTAMSITNTLKSKNYNLNCNLILAGAMLHDIGRSQSQKINHAVLGANILREKGFPDKLVKIVEKHIFAGISAEDSVEFNLPYQDYIPDTLEEKIVTYSDNISKKNNILSTIQVITRFSRFLPVT